MNNALLKYFIRRLEAGKVKYTTVVEKYPDYQAAINEQLAEDGYAVGDDGYCYKI